MHTSVCGAAESALDPLCLAGHGDAVPHGHLLGVRHLELWPVPSALWVVRREGHSWKGMGLLGAWMMCIRETGYALCFHALQAG